MSTRALMLNYEIEFINSLRDIIVLTTCPGLMIIPPLEAIGNSRLVSMSA